MFSVVVVKCISGIENYTGYFIFIVSSARKAHSNQPVAGRTRAVATTENIGEVTEDVR